MIEVTAHAAARFRERIDPALTLDQARAAIHGSTRAIEAAAGFGCRIVKLGGGGRLVLDGATVVTVLAPGQGCRDMLAPLAERVRA